MEGLNAPADYLSRLEHGASTGEKQNREDLERLVACYGRIAGPKLTFKTTAAYLAGLSLDDAGVEEKTKTTRTAKSYAFCNGACSVDCTLDLD